MGEGLLYRAAEPEEAKTVSDVALEWLTNNGDVDIKIVDVSLVYSNVQGYFYNVEFESEAGTGMLKIVGDNGKWIVEEI